MSSSARTGSSSISKRLLPVRVRVFVMRSVHWKDVQLQSTGYRKIFRMCGPFSFTLSDAESRSKPR